MRTTISILSALLALVLSSAGLSQDQSSAWKAALASDMPLMGHRNWILVVDSAYPLQSSPGIETVETNADQLTVVKSVLDMLQGSSHVRPVAFMDSELPFVPEKDAPGVSAYRAQVAKMLSGFPVSSQLHANVLADIDGAGKSYHVLVLKTTMTIPYTSVFFRLDCEYWSAEAEKRMRASMSSGSAK